jgi:hypothetical protein
MKKLSDIFELPVSGQDVSEFYYLDCSDEEDDDAIAHAINHFDALADALELILGDKAIFNIDSKSHAKAVSVLVDYRGEK